ncbi:MAG TPA: patatin-like phospholipase family protein [Edaphocola sp.]|nr:patatin-like phospholipase family protein [Edaphocola sp.]
MKALVISGGGSKGAFAGGVAQFLMQDNGRNYELFVGTSTGSLLLPHLALGKINKIRRIYTSIRQRDIFSSNPFTIKVNKQGEKKVGINHFNVLKNFMKGAKTFGESYRLKTLIKRGFNQEEFEELKQSSKDIVVTVSNLSLNQIEYKSIKDFEYDDFCEWIWISGNFAPFMSLVEKDGYEYADGGFGVLVPIEEAINRGATEIDVIVLKTEITEEIIESPKNAFSLTTDIHLFMADRIEKQNIRIGKFIASQKKILLNFYYTPINLTNNSLIFDKELMSQWWAQGYLFAKNKNKDTADLDNLNE